MLPWGTCDSRVPREPFKRQSFGARDKAYIRQTSCMRVALHAKKEWGWEEERTGNGAV